MALRQKKAHINQKFINAARFAYLVKGGFVRLLPPELDPGSAFRAKAKRRPDWGALRAEKRRGPKPYPRLVLQCQNPQCKKRPATFKGKTMEQALIRSWEVGWYYKLERRGEEDEYELCFCPKCKPGVQDGKFRKGMVLHNRKDGELYEVVQYLGKGQHPVNIGYWPELWCKDSSGGLKVFIFWNGKIQDGLVEHGS